LKAPNEQRMRFGFSYSMSSFGVEVLAPWWLNFIT